MSSSPNNETQPYVAQKYLASSPEAEVLGAVVIGLAKNLMEDELKPLLAEFNLENIDPTVWYPQQLTLNFDKALVNGRENSSEKLVAIGLSEVDHAPLNPAENTIESAVQALAGMLRQVERNVPDNETFSVAESRSGYALVIANMPQPDDMIYGYLWGIARRYKPVGSKFTVRVVDNPAPQAKPGTAFEITWG